ncbi:EAL domain-containing protein [Paenibacillus wynnii]|uniref:EAL domain-containing protein n=1 Tax=Paenibacillus wynnii TaxID=268407 RepID=UPI001470618F|nr:EAL domain-containing protein [Paenibacillus wynnii]
MRILSINLFSIAGAGICCAILVKTFLSFSGKDRHFWLLLLLGTVCFIIAQSIWLYYQMRYNRAAPYPSWADFFWLLQYGLFLVALIYKRTANREKPGIHSFFNIIIFMAIATTFSLQFLLNPILKSGNNSVLALITTIAYPTFDLGFLFATVSLYYKSHYNEHKRVIFLILTGFVIQIVADSLHIYYLMIGTYEQASYIDPLWIVPLLLIGIAGNRAQHYSAQTCTKPEVISTEDKELDLLPYIGVVVLLFVMLFVRDESVNALKIGLFVVTLLIIMRQVFIIVANRNLLRELKTKNEELGKSEERYRQVVEISPNAISVEVNGEIVYLNKAGFEMLGATSLGEIIGKSVLEIVPQEYYATMKSRHKQVSTEKKAAKPFVFPILRLDGKTIYVESSLTEIHYNGELAFLLVAQDITQRKKIEERIKYLAYYDELTGLPNRAKFHEQLIKQIKLAERKNNLLAVLFLDLDRFKLINDTMGHGFGDLFLKKVAERLAGNLALKGMVYRLGGDEFCLIITQTSPEKVSTLAQLIIDELSVPFIIKKGEYFTSPSIGISLYPTDGCQPDELIRLADIAMYKSKKHGGNTYQYYSSLLDGENYNKLKLDKELRKAIENHEFVIYYQPKVNLTTGKIIGWEALLRWLHPERGLVPPLEFIPIAEETGLIIPIGHWVLQEACQQMKKWQEAGMSELSIAVNISPRQFRDKNLIQNVSEILRETGLAAQYLEIEVTETVMQNIQETSMLLQELKMLGVQISIDDFGTGYSSLSYLKYLPIDYLKIDKSFVNDITTCSKDEAIVQTIVDMGHHMKINVVAEGIENEQQLHSLVKLKCNVGQGYFFSKPLPANQAEQLSNQVYIKST